MADNNTCQKILIKLTMMCEHLNIESCTMMVKYIYITAHPSIWLS